MLKFKREATSLNSLCIESCFFSKIELLHLLLWDLMYVIWSARKTTNMKRWFDIWPYTICRMTFSSNTKCLSTSSHGSSCHVWKSLAFIKLKQINKIWRASDILTPSCWWDLLKSVRPKMFYRMLKSLNLLGKY